MEVPVRFPTMGKKELLNQLLSIITAVIKKQPSIRCNYMYNFYLGESRLVTSGWKRIKKKTSITHVFYVPAI